MGGAARSDTPERKAKPEEQFVHTLLLQPVLGTPGSFRHSRGPTSYLSVLAASPAQFIKPPRVWAQGQRKQGPVAQGQEEEMATQIP